MRAPLRGAAAGALLALAAASAAQPAQVRAELRSGPTVDTPVERVEPWGLVVSRQGSGLMFRHILTLRMASDSLAALIAAELPGVPTRREGAEVVLDLAALDLPLRPARLATGARRSLRPFAAGAAGAFAGVETGLTVSTRFTGPVVLSVSHLASWSATDGAYLGGFGVGAGLELPTPAATLAVGGQVWARYPGDLSPRSPPFESGRTAAVNAASVSVSVARPLGGDRLRAFVGARAFVFDVDGAGAPVSGFAGISTSL